MIGEERYGRCPMCGNIAELYGRPRVCTGYSVQGHSPTVMEPVAVLPLAEAEALQRLRAALEDDALVDSEAMCFSCSQRMYRFACDACRGREDGIAAYRTALIQRMKGETG